MNFPSFYSFTNCNRRGVRNDKRLYRVTNVPELQKQLESTHLVSPDFMKRNGIISFRGKLVQA